MNSSNDFARRMQRELDEFNAKRSPGKRTRRPATRYQPEPNKHVITVKLVVRKRYIAADEYFYHFSERLSELEAEIEAKRAAVAAGYPIFGYVVYVMRGVKNK
ncbi:hypothetical protein ACT3R7_11700 [Halomonas sp. AOP43-A1-21]